MPKLLAYYSDLLPVIAFFLFLIKRKEKVFWVIFFYSICSFITNTVLLNNQNESIVTVLSVFTGVEYIFFSVILYLFISSHIIKKLIVFISIFFILFLITTILFESKYQFDSLQTSIESILIIGFCIIFLFEQINQPQLSFIYTSYNFWIVIGILTYLAITFFLYVFAASLPLEVADEYWIINHIASILKNILFTIAIILYVKPPKMHNHGEYRPFLS